MHIFKILIQTIGLTTLLSNIVSAQPHSGLLYTDLAINIAPENLKTYLTKANEGWFAYSIPAAEKTHSMCCFTRGKQAVCDLGKKQHGFGTSDASAYTDNIHVFVNLKQGQVNQIMPIGEHCKVKAEGITVDWLTDVSEQQSIQWLKTQATENKQSHHNGSLYALALHHDKAAPEALFDLAKDNAGDYSEQAIFWLGQRQQDGFTYLKSLYQDLPSGEVRRHVNFALSENNDTRAIDLLKSIAQQDKDVKQQADAIFWLSQSGTVADLPAFLNDLINTSENYEVKEKAIFSMSQINTDEANGELMKLNNNHKDPEVREKALFWLSQNDPKMAKQAALEMLKSESTTAGKHHKEWENAVFILSQLPGSESSAALFQIVQGDYARPVKKKALFWLSQSDDADTLKQLEDLL